MKGPTETREADEGLPSFLDPTSSAEATDHREDDAELDSDEPYDEQGADADDYEDDDYDESWGDDEDGDDAAADDDEQDDADEHGPARRASSRRTAARGPAPTSSGGLGMGAGVLLTLVGFVAAALPTFAAALSGAGLEPQAVVVVGLVVFGLGAGQRRLALLQQRLDALQEERRAVDDELRESFAELLHRAKDPTDDTVSEGDRLQHALLSLQRQDQKINNLTKAIKMYGKPLMEIANQGTEISGGVGQLKGLVEGATELQRQGLQRVEHAVAKAAERGGDLDLGDLPQKVEKLGVSLAAMGQRLEDTEVRKSLVRLEDATRQLREELASVQRKEHADESAQQLKQSLEQATRGLTSGLEALREGNLGALETGVREIQREVSGLATGVAQLQAAVKSGATARTTSQPPAAQPAPAAQTSATQTAAAPGAPASSAPAKGGDDSSGYSTGKRKSTGKNVLGAIAKLKQMKG